jgi:hypothetical protein
MTAELNSVRALVSPEALELADHYAVFAELETVLRCCERLVTELQAQPDDEAQTDDDAQPDDDAQARVVVEALWTLALLSYARCFDGAAVPASGRLTRKDLQQAQPDAAASEWHDMLLRLRAHHAHERLNPREEFAVGAAQDETGRAAGIAVTSRHQPEVDVVTVRQTGALAYALRQHVSTRIVRSERALMSSVADLPRPALDALGRLDIVGGA